MIKAFLLSVQVLLAEPGDIQEYRVYTVNVDTGLRQDFITTDKRFNEHRRGSCVIIKHLNKERVYFGGSC
jgi:hypothetical protein